MLHLPAPKIILCLLAAFGGLSGSLSAALDDAPAPLNHVFDDTRALEESSQRTISTQLKTLSEDLKCDVWLTATTFATGNRTLRQQAFSTRTRWSPDRPAILLAYVRTDNGFVFSFSPDMWHRYPTASLVDLTRDGTERIKNDKLPLDERLLYMVQDFARKMRALEVTRIQQTQRFMPEERRFVSLLALLVTAASVVAGMLGILSRRTDTAAGEAFHLPEVSVGTRLGAPYGGGLIAEALGTPAR
jgi:hypothetical protein